MNKIRNFIFKHQDFCATAVIIISVLALFLPSLPYDRFVLDDSSYIGQSHLFELTWSNIRYHLYNKTIGLYSPLVMFSFMPDYLVWGKEYFISGCRMQNILWHLFSAILLYRIFRMFKVSLKDTVLEIPPAAALFAVLCWALHPQRMESVIWIAERKDVMVLTFALLIIYFIIKAHCKNRTSIAAPILMLISLFTIKPLLVTFPLLAFTGFLVATNANIKLSLKRTWPLFLATIIYVGRNFIKFSEVAELAIEQTERGESRAPLAAWNIFQYALKTIFPFKLSPLYPYYENGEISFLVLVILFALAALIIFLAFKKTAVQEFCAKLLLPGGIMFGLAVLPISGLHRIGNTDIADRYSYFPSIFIWCGAALLITILYNWCKKNPKAIIIAASAYTAVLTAMSVSYMSAWKDTKSQLDAMLIFDRPHPAAIQMAAMEEYEQGNFPEAMRYVLMINKEDIYSRVFRDCLTGIVLARLDRTEEAFTYISELFSKKYWNFLTGCPSNMRTDCITFISNYHLQRISDPVHRQNLSFVCRVVARLLEHHDMKESLNYLGVAMLIQNDFKNAEQYFDWALKNFPDYEHFQRNLDAAKQQDISKISISKF